MVKLFESSVWIFARSGWRDVGAKGLFLLLSGVELSRTKCGAARLSHLEKLMGVFWLFSASTTTTGLVLRRCFPLSVLLQLNTGVMSCYLWSWKAECSRWPCGCLHGQLPGVMESRMGNRSAGQKTDSGLCVASSCFLVQSILIQ